MTAPRPRRLRIPDGIPRPARHTHPIVGAMDLLIVRHAPAADAAPGGADHERPLTPEGRARFARAVAGLARLEIEADAAWHSPWRRAAETAHLLRPVVSTAPVAEPLLAAAPGRALLARLAGSPAGDRLALVGHEPWLGELATWLCFGEAALASGLAVRKGSVLWLRGAPTPGGMVLEAVLKPSLLRRIGELGPPAPSAAFSKEPSGSQASPASPESRASPASPASAPSPASAADPPPGG